MLRRVIGSHNPLEKVVVAGHHVREVIGDEDPSDVRLDHLGCLSVFLELSRVLVVGIKDEGLEGHPVLGDVVDLGHGSDHVVSRGPVELVVFSLLVLIRLPHPEGLDTLDHLVAGHAGADVDLVPGRGGHGQLIRGLHESLSQAGAGIVAFWVTLTLGALSGHLWWVSFRSSHCAGLITWHTGLGSIGTGLNNFGFVNSSSCCLRHVSVNASSSSVSDKQGLKQGL